MIRVSVVGSTGSIGCSTIDVISRALKSDEGNFEVEAVIAGRNFRLLAEQAKAVKASIAVISDDSAYAELKSALEGTGIECAAGEKAVLEAASRSVDKSMAAISGTAGLLPTLAAIDAGNDILLANKETMVCAGPMVRERASASGSRIIPVDSEHNAIFQVYETASDIEKITLTASGGPFRNASLETMRDASIARALAHPNWDMGAKNSLDSATMMNKGLELIEAAYLFDMPESQIDIVIHPQSIVHALVYYIDGSVLAQLSQPDMRTPIAHALAWPRRIESGVERLDLTHLGKLDFSAPDDIRFPALKLARQAARAGPLGTCIFNAANERAGQIFLNGKCGFLDIADQVAFALDRALSKDSNHLPSSVASIEDVLYVTQNVFRWIDNRLGVTGTSRA